MFGRRVAIKELLHRAKNTRTHNTKRALQRTLVVLSRLSAELQLVSVLRDKITIPGDKLLEPTKRSIFNASLVGGLVAKPARARTLLNVSRLKDSKR